MRWIGLALCLLAAPALADQQPDAKPITWTKCSGTITAGNTAQTLALGSGPLRGFFLQNPSTATNESLFFDPNGTATTTSIEVQRGGPPITFGPGTIFVGNSPSILGATTSHAFTCYYGM